MDQERQQQLNQLSANLSAVEAKISRTHRENVFNRLLLDTKRIASQIRIETGCSEMLPESIRKAFVDALAQGPLQKTLLRYELEGVVGIQEDHDRRYEYRADGHVNMIEDGVIIYTTEPFEEPIDNYTQQRSWSPRLTPIGIKSFRIRGLL